MTNKTKNDAFQFPGDAKGAKIAKEVCLPALTHQW
jgi:hypothetical protein